MKLDIIKTGLHPRNKHRGRYDFDQLIQASSGLAQFVRLNEFGDASVDFSNPQAVKALNQALLKQFYAIAVWDIPNNIFARQFQAAQIICITSQICSALPMLA